MALRCPVQSRRESDPGFRTELENLVGSVKGKGTIVSRRREECHAVWEMRVDPSEPPCRGRFQTAISCYGPMAAVVNVMVKRRDFLITSCVDERDECK